MTDLFTKDAAIRARKIQVASAGLINRLPEPIDEDSLEYRLLSEIKRLASDIQQTLLRNDETMLNEIRSYKSLADVLPSLWFDNMLVNLKC